ncbi:hypothetical protein H7097_03810 [Aeromicrobium sp.]|nr:hypothetical protein [Candidatus Saccharibacteria bacterium]
MEAESVVYRFTGQTYGSCNPEEGLPVSYVPDEYPIFIIPYDAVIGDI